MYFQCDPEEDLDAWSEARIWDELQARVAGPDGFSLMEGPITDKAVLRFRSFVAEPMRWGNLLLAGDAAHTVPPTGAKGLNLALADVRVLVEILEPRYTRGTPTRSTSTQIAPSYASGKPSTPPTKNDHPLHTAPDA